LASLFRSHGEEWWSDPSTLAEIISLCDFCSGLPHRLHHFAAQLAAKPFAQMDLQLILLCSDKKIKGSCRDTHPRTHELNDKVCLHYQLLDKPFHIMPIIASIDTYAYAFVDVPLKAGIDVSDVVLFAQSFILH
jgi:hypothetical protein